MRDLRMEESVARIGAVVDAMIARFDEIAACAQDRGKPTRSEIEKFNRQYKGLTVEHSDDFHDRYILIDNAELHNLGSSINYLGCRVTNYSTSDPKEIKKLHALLGD